MPWSKWWSCPCHQQESPRPADYLYSLDSPTHTQRQRHTQNMRSQSRNAGSWPAPASTSALAGPAVPATKARPSMAPAAKRSSPSTERGDAGSSNSEWAWTWRVCNYWEALTPQLCLPRRESPLPKSWQHRVRPGAHWTWPLSAQHIHTMLPTLWLHAATLPLQPGWSLGPRRHSAS